jgi:hypothetical protein
MRLSVVQAPFNIIEKEECAEDYDKSAHRGRLIPVCPREPCVQQQGSARQ